MNTLSSRMVLVLLGLLVACDGVGRALVDKRTPSSASVQHCQKEAPCGSTLPPLPFPSAAGDFGDLSFCDTPNPLPIVGDTLPTGPCDCQQYELHLGPSPATQSWLGASLQRCVVNISADQPISVELPRAMLDNVAIKLTGPIALAIRASQLARVRVRGIATAAGAPSLALEDSDAFHFALATEQATFDRLSMSHGTLEDALLETHSAHFESVAVRRSTITATDFDASDISISETELALGHALISEPSLDKVRLRDCGRVRFVGGQLSRTESSCSELLQLYSVEAVRDSWLDGPIESDGSDFENTSLGNAQKTALLGYESSLVRVTFCQGVERVRLSHGFLSCVACSGALADDPSSVCSETGGITAEQDDNSCPALAEVPVCEDFPARRRPQ